MSINEKKQFVAEVNSKNKTFFRYDYKTDSVIEEFNVKSVPVPFEEWQAEYR